MKRLIDEGNPHLIFHLDELVQPLFERGFRLVGVFIAAEDDLKNFLSMVAAPPAQTPRMRLKHAGFLGGVGVGGQAGFPVALVNLQRAAGRLQT